MQDTTPLRTIVRVVTRLNIGGPAQQVLWLSQALNHDGWETTVITGLPDSSEGDLGHQLDPSVPLVRLVGLQRAIHPIKDLMVWWQLVQTLHRIAPDVLHTHMAKAGLLGRLAGMTYNVLQVVRGRHGRVRLVHTFHGHVLAGYFGRIATSIFIHLERWLARRTDVLIAVSPAVRDDLLRLGIGEASRIQVVSLGLDLSRFFSVNGSSGVLRRELNLPPEARLVGIVGRLVPVKQHEMFLRAAQRLLNDDPSLFCVIVGDGERRRELEDLAQRLGIAERVRFLGWRFDLPEIYADLDCVCLTSRNEGTPVSVIEALACGRPVVATRVGGVVDLLGDGVERQKGYEVAQRGILVVDAVEPDGLVAAVQRVLADAPLSARWAEAGRTFARAHLTGERLTTEIEALYTQVLQVAPGTAREPGTREERAGASLAVHEADGIGVRPPTLTGGGIHSVPSGTERR